MTNRNFSDWISGFRSSIADYQYYVDFEKIYKNIDAMKIELNILNSLIGCPDIEEKFAELIKKYPETLDLFGNLDSEKKKKYNRPVRKP